MPGFPFRSSLIIPVACAALLALPPRLYSFHDGGVGSCDGCHTMHGPAAGGMGNGMLTTAQDPSSTCLKCHADGNFSVKSNDGSRTTPAGDFFWLTRTYSWTTSDGIARSSPGYSHGHSIVAVEHGLSADPVNSVSPGGTYPSSALGCTGCHDPHGKIAYDSIKRVISGSGSYDGTAPSDGTFLGNFRLLGGVGYDGGEGQEASFSHGAPVAIAPGGSDSTETDSRHVAYGSGMSEWCGNCHTGYLNSHHPSGPSRPLVSGMLLQYNQYVATGDLSGSAEFAYLALVPFETGSTSASTLDPYGTRGPENGAQPMCLSCHRAHASAFVDIGRWDFTEELLINSHPDGYSDGSTYTEKIYSYYNRDLETEFGSQQRQLCEKCHGGGAGWAW